jgi:hypothetical protein
VLTSVLERALDRGDEVLIHAFELFAGVWSRGVFGERFGAATRGAAAIPAGGMAVLRTPVLETPNWIGAGAALETFDRFGAGNALVPNRIGAVSPGERDRCPRPSFRVAGEHAHQTPIRGLRIRRRRCALAGEPVGGGGDCRHGRTSALGWDVIVSL